VLALPEAIRPLVERCAVDREESAGVSDRDQLVGRVAAELHTDAATAEEIARAVFAGVRRLLPDKEARDVTSQLPLDLAALWQSA
jgi:uncharacterized protein (DUF2267 family)